MFLIPLFLCALIIPPAAAGVGVVLNTVTDMIIDAVGLLSSIPDALISLGYPFVKYTFAAIIVGIICILIIRKRFSYILPYICWFVTFILCFSAYTISYGTASDVILYSESGSDAIIVRNNKGSIYIDLGKGSDAAEDRAFSVMEDIKCINELDYWVITHYSNNIVYSTADYMNDFYIRNIMLPYPTDDIGRAAAAEIEYYTEKENVKCIYYEYGQKLTLNGVEIVMYEPYSFEDSSVFIPSASLKCGGDEVFYAGSGYFDYCDYQNLYDYLYIGECGTKRKQINSPAITANHAVIAEYNDVATLNVEGEIIRLDDGSAYKEFRIGK